jgi:hypothetical protein
MLLGALILAGVGQCISGQQPLVAQVIAQAQEDSLKQLSYHACSQAEPGLRYRVSEAVQRAPGRWQFIRRRKSDQLVCTAWQGKLLSVDTAYFQPGNGHYSR